MEEVLVSALYLKTSTLFLSEFDFFIFLSIHQALWELFHHFNTEQSSWEKTNFSSHSSKLWITKKHGVVFTNSKYLGKCNIFSRLLFTSRQECVKFFRACSKAAPHQVKFVASWRDDKYQFILFISVRVKHLYYSNSYHIFCKDASLSFRKSERRWAKKNNNYFENAPFFLLCQE